jgi:hypothetical protein
MRVGMDETSPETVLRSRRGTIVDSLINTDKCVIESEDENVSRSQTTSPQECYSGADSADRPSVLTSQLLSATRSRHASSFQSAASVVNDVGVPPVGLLSFMLGELTHGYALQNDPQRYKEKRRKVYAFVQVPRELEKFLYARVGVPGHNLL